MKIAFKPYQQTSPVLFPENPVNVLVIDILKVRQHCLREGKGRRDLDTFTRLGRVSKNFAAFPNRSEYAAARFFMQWQYELRQLIPGKQSSAHHSIVQRFTEVHNWAVKTIATNLNKYGTV